MVGKCGVVCTSLIVLMVQNVESHLVQALQCSKGPTLLEIIFGQGGGGKMRELGVLAGKWGGDR